MTDMPHAHPNDHEAMRHIIEALDEIFNGDQRHPDKNVGFVLLTFPYGATDGQANYASNGARRDDIIQFLRMTADRLEKKEDNTWTPPTH